MNKTYLEDKIKINTIYTGIEGEGLFIGTPTIFLRLQGCSLQCNWCDSKETWNVSGGKNYSLLKLRDKLLRIREKSNIKRVSITGGSPLENPHIDKLIQMLKEENFYLNLETNGQNYNPNVFSMVDFISSDYKTISSGLVQDKSVLDKIINEFGSRKLQVKAVISNNNDLDDFLDFIKKYNNFSNFIITPIYNGNNIDINLIKYIERKISKSSVPVRMICQQHKFIWGADKKDC